MRLELQSQKSIDLSFGKTFDLGAIASISTLEEQYVIDSEPKEEFIWLQNDQLAAIYMYTSKFKGAWWAQFLSHTLQTLEINLSFEAVKLILRYLTLPFSF